MPQSDNPSNNTQDSTDDQPPARITPHTAKLRTRLIESIRRDNDDTLLKKCSFENRESSVEAIR